MVDTVDLYQDITRTNPFNTYIPNMHTQCPSRIDSIWISYDLLMKTITSSNLTPEVYSSDHLLIFINFFTDNLFSKKSIASLKQHDMRKHTFTYNIMTTAKWDQFQAATKDATISADLVSMSFIN